MSQIDYLLHGASSLTRIKATTQKSLNDFESISGLEPPQFPSGILFWDVVVLTTADVHQKDAFRSQIDEKIAKKQIPLIDLRIYSDPPGAKIGNGGSTLWVLDRLRADFSCSQLASHRILILHAGGQSKRLPSCSVLGKVFAPLPLTLQSLGIPFQATALDVLLALSLPLVSKVPLGGCMVHCADIILPLALDDDTMHQEERNGEGEGDGKGDRRDSFHGFVALAHPSDLSIGEGHGVYVLPPSFTRSTSSSSSTTTCLKVLQKPSIAKMRQDGAVVAKTLDGGSRREFVYTDSVFWFDSAERKTLLEIYDMLTPIDVEIDAYGDFLQALGQSRSADYTSNLGNITTQSNRIDSTEFFKDKTVSTRKKVFDCLKDSELSVLVLNESFFLHIGTTKEYLELYTSDPSFSSLFTLSQNHLNSPDSKTGTEANSNASTISQPKKVFSRFYSTATGGAKCLKTINKAETPTFIKGCVMSSVLDRTSIVPPNSVVEYCMAKGPIQVGRNSIWSNCKIDVKQIKAEVVIPDNLMIHTIAVDSNLYENEREGKKIEEEEGKGRKIQGAREEEDGSRSRFNSLSEDERFSLWEAPLFSVKASMEESFGDTLELLNNLASGKIQHFEIRDKISLADAVKTKDVTTMLSYRAEIREDVTFKSGFLL